MQLLPTPTEQCDSEWRKRILSSHILVSVSLQCELESFHRVLRSVNDRKCLESVHYKLYNLYLHSLLSLMILMPL